MFYGTRILKPKLKNVQFELFKLISKKCSNCHGLLIGELLDRP